MNDNPTRTANASMDQAVQYMQLSRRQLAKYQATGKLTAVYFGRKRFFKWSELEKLAKTGTR